MKASELRIGNIIQTKENKLVRINLFARTSIDCNYLEDIGDYEEEDEITRFLDEFNPVPLTEEWLLKFGFFIKEQISSDNFLGCRLYQDSNSDEFVIPFEGIYHYVRDISSSDFDGSTQYRTTEFQYIHQLQNLYFALTGTELEIK